jgi:UDP-2,3-diacylglucosamine hydrolase
VIGHRLVVVADAHLGAASASDEEAFLAFLDTVPSLGDSLLLAGDIYDFWFTYRRLIPRHCIRVTARIVELARRIPVLMIGGNHDRWGDTFWGPETGVTFHPRELRFQVGTRSVLAVHGDGLHEERPVAGALNRILDTRAVIATFSMLPSSLGFRIARRFGHDPAYAAAHPEVVEMAVRRQARWAEQFLESHPEIGMLLMAHTHRPASREIERDRWYVNPGAWLDDRRYAVVDSAGVQLTVFT